MSASRQKDDDYAFLRIDRYLRTFIDVHTLGRAFELGVIDRLRDAGGLRAGQLLPSADEPGLGMMIDLLAANAVVEARSGRISLTPEFLRDLDYRDLIEAKITFARLVTPDVADYLTELLVNPAEFQRRARVFELFGYQRCFDLTPENLELTRRWVRITTAYTKYEAGVLLGEHEFGGYRRLLDIGGNSGEFCRQACRRCPQLEAVVADLPVVCELGRENIADDPSADRISFLALNALVDPLPVDQDVVVFKSFLHDWPADAVSAFIRRARTCLAPGGTLLIFERGPMSAAALAGNFSLLPMFLFFRHFRRAAIYRAKLAQEGFTDVDIRSVELDVPFHIIVARRTP